jgi:predicted component of type VI protein secretion system
MAKLTVTFKGRTIQHLPLETGATGIGRDTDNALQIDSLAVAPHHAVVDVEARGMVIKQLNDDFPLLVNGRKLKEHVLQDGDCITLGKHDIYFMDDDPTARVGGSRKQSDGRDTDDAATGSAEAATGGEAGLQLLNGKQIGLVIPLRNPLTRLDRDDSSSAVIARRTDGYYLASLSTHDGTNISINGKAIGDGSVRLNNGDMIKINQHKLRFFIGS